MKYEKAKRTKHLSLRDIHVGDWVQVWSEATERYSPPLKISSICDDGTIYFVLSDEEQLTPWEEDIKNVDALPITKDLLKGFGFDLSESTEEWGYTYIIVSYKGEYVGHLKYTDDKEVSLQVHRGICEYMHELIQHNYRFNLIANFEWKGVKNEREV